MSLRLAAVLAASIAPFVSSSALADTCDPTRVMVILDKSSSMQTGSIGDKTKWDIAVNGLGDVLGTYDAKAEFGLMTYPRPNQCSPGGLDVAPAMHNRQPILDALSTPPPSSGNWTPMAQTLDVALTEPSLASTATSAARHVILITDGWQWCSPYDPNTRYDGTDAVGRLQAAGITTWIVGFGADVDTAALNQMAVVAGTARPNCNASNTDPSAPDQCYFQVDNSAELVAALTQIANVISADEICDGIDNDCDGQIDEDLVQSCDNACGAGTERCEAGEWKGCDAPVAMPETCDEIDNDCDGAVDNGGVCGSPEVPDTEPETGGDMQAGCACDTGTPLSVGGLLPFALAALSLRRRRR